MGKKKDYIWNTAAGVINAGQSAIILIFISRGLDAEAAGIFTIGYALANLFSAIGKYAIRNYQVTDIKEEYSFADYLMLRGVTVFLAIFIMAIYACVQFMIDAYSVEKVIVVILIGLWKMVDAVEDVFYGMYQQRNRLDLGSKCYFVRLLASSILYCILVLIGVSLLYSTLITVLFSITVAFGLIKSTCKHFNVNLCGAKKRHVNQMLVDCLPLCVGVSLSIYAGNIPKYLIDAYMDEITQAYFGFLMMPAFVTLMLSGFIYHPMVRNFGVLWRNQETKKILDLIGKIVLIIMGFSFIVVFFGMWIGLDILSWVYGVNLLTFEKEFLVLLIGGGVFAIVNFLVVPLTSIREQKNIAIGFLAVSILGLLCGKMLVVNWGMIGVTVLYLVQNIFLCLYFFMCLLRRLLASSNHQD